MARSDEAVAAAIARLQQHPDWQILVEELSRRREVYFVNFARGLARSREPIDQREVDEKRGFWAGALWSVLQFPKQMFREDEKNVAEALAREEQLQEGRGS